MQTPQERVRTSPYPERRRRPASSDVYQPATSHIFRLVMQPIVKATVGERDSSGDSLDPFVAGGTSFQDILEKIWDQFSFHVKGRAVKSDGAWAVEPAAIDSWSKFMVFKVKKHIIDSSKSDEDWNAWLQSMHDKTVTLLIYDYGVGLGRKQDRQAFQKDCILPAETDRAGAAAEVTLREVVGRLQDLWGATYTGKAVVWRMWATEVVRSQDRTAWEDKIRAPPPLRVLRLLSAAHSRIQEHLDDLNHSTQIALDCVNASIAGSMELRRDWEAYRHRLESFETMLQSRKAQIESLLHYMPLPAIEELVDPLQNMENLEDFEHQ
ncbi:hypothetical protein L916_10270 [Phytophthora nicotianae]|uniref:Uncharacterized protein n=1 Tax=Phytophthora nicotianae TaxID=4792 RepID=W2IXM5_PHYNI|nr:hypothetical protein L916_10270 [Phytophthora nicotianae]